MASPAAASPVPASPTGFSPPNTSPNVSARSSPRSPGPSKAPKPSRDICLMILSWLRNAVPNILQANGHRPRHSESDDPANVLAMTLRDGLVLADLVSFLDPIRLPPATINRGTARNAMSMPGPSASSPSHGSNIDTRQLFLQYKNNARRIISAVKLVLTDVRNYSGFPHRPTPGAVEGFLGNVPAVLPTQDLRPSIRLAELVIATAVYGPRHNEFRHSIWRFPNEATGSAFHVAMSAVAQAVALPPPDLLYAAGPPPPRAMHSQGMMSPAGQPLPKPMLSPQARVLSPRPPLSPHPHSPVLMSPRATFIPKPILHPYPGQPSGQPSGQASPLSAPHRKPPTVPQPPSPRSGMSPPLPGSQQSQAARTRSNRTSPRSGMSPQQPSSPRMLSPHRGSGAGSPHPPATVPPAVSSPTQGRTPRTSSASSRPTTSSSRHSVRMPTKDISPQAGSSVAPLTRTNAPDAKAVPMMDENMQSRTAAFDEGMDGRKLSMVTDDSTSPQEGSSRGDAADSSGDLRAVASVARHVVESDFVQSMRVLEEEHRMQREEHPREETSPPQFEDNSEEREQDSKRSSEEFFTPNELSPSPTPEATSTSKQSALKVPSPRPSASREELISPDISQVGYESGPRQYYKDTKVDETVRKSVSTSVTEHISRGPQSRPVESERDSRQAAPQLFRSESTTSSIEMNPAFMMSPSTSGAPSPSNQWQFSMERGSSQDILSPLPMFSPPTMPTSQARAAYVTPPYAGGSSKAPLFRPGLYSPQLSVSSAGGHSAAEVPENRGDIVPPPIQPKRLSDSSARGCTQAQAQNRGSTSSTGGLPPRPPKSLSTSSLPIKRSPQSSPSPQHQQNIPKTRVSFAPTIISPGGHARPLGEPLKCTEDSQKRSQPQAGSSSGPFALPPSSADQDGKRQSTSRQQIGKESEAARVDVESEETGRSDLTYSQQSYHTARSTLQDDLPIQEEHSGFEADDGEGDVSEPFQEVKEYVLYNSDEEKLRLEQRQAELREAVDDSDDVEQPLHQRGSYEEGGYDMDVEDDDSGAHDDVSPRDEEEDLEPAAEDEFPKAHVNLGDDLEPTPRTDMESMSISQSEMQEQFLLSTEHGPSGYVPGPSDFITPPVAMRVASRSARSGQRLKDIPPTPPSPPDIQTLMESISRTNLESLEEAEDQEDVDDAPVSTMEPSPGLFQKLIAVWQSADEQGTRPEDLMTAEHRPASSRFTCDVEMSHMSAVESTNPSGNTETDRDRPRTSSSRSDSRRARPQAMRLPPAVAPSSQYAQEVVGPSEKRDEQEERTSLASFSDAFSSDDKDRGWHEHERTHSEGVEWEEAMKGDTRAGLPISPSHELQQLGVGGSEGGKSTEEGTGTETETGPSDNQGPIQRVKSPPSTDYEDSGVATDGRHVKVDRRRLDWLTKELLAARDAISRKELQMTFAQTQRIEQEEVLLLERQEAESLVGSMKKILAEREYELQDARNRLSVAIQSGPVVDEEGDEVEQSGQARLARPSTQVEARTHATHSGHSGYVGQNRQDVQRGQTSGEAHTTTETAKDQRISVESSSSNKGGANLEKLITEGNAKLHQRFDECNSKHEEASGALNTEMRGLWNEVQRAMVEKMSEMTEKRDGELEVLRRELANRERLIYELKESSSDLVDQNRAMQAEASELRMQKEKTAHRYELEMAHVTAQVELVNEFSKKLHDNFRETENLRQQVLQYQDKLAHIASTSGVSQRQIKELREAVSRANDECARLRREADMAKKKGMEAVRRAEELEELRYKDAAAHSAGRFPDRQDSGSFRSHEPVRPAGHNRPGGSGVNTRYHATRRGMGGGPSPAQKAWLVIKDKIGGMVTGKEGGSRRRLQGGHRADMMRGMGGSQSSRSQSRSRVSRDDDMLMRSRSGSGSLSNRSESVGGGSVQSGGSRSNRSGGGGTGAGGAGMMGAARSAGSGSIDGDGGEGGGVGSGVLDERTSIDDDYMQGPVAYGKGEVGRIRATDF